MASNNLKSSSSTSTSEGEAAGSSGGPEPNQNPHPPTQDNSTYECNICLDTARDAVVSMCGHLFCWPCLHQWLEIRPNQKRCPVCKAGISRDKVIPLYGRGNVNREDPREKVPPRPQGQRAEPENSSNSSSFGNNGFQMSFGIGAFPFGFFASSFNMHDGRHSAPQPGMPQQSEDSFLSQVFLVMAVIFIFWILIA